MRFFILISLSIVVLSCNKTDCGPSACSLTPDAGICEAYIPKYYFDADSKKCKEFIWGGCDGVVPFDTKEDCKVCKCK